LCVEKNALAQKEHVLFLGRRTLAPEQPSTDLTSITQHYDHRIAELKGKRFNLHAGEQQHSSIWFVIPMLPCNHLLAWKFYLPSGVLPVSSPLFTGPRGKRMLSRVNSTTKMETDYSTSMTTCTRKLKQNWEDCNVETLS
jgi:hypothetical protein